MRKVIHFSVLLVIIWPTFLAPSAIAASPCASLFGSELVSAKVPPSPFRAIDVLERAMPPHAKHKFRVFDRASLRPLPVDFRAYRNAQFVRVTKGQRPDVKPGQTLTDGPIYFGYEVASEFKSVGVLAFILQDAQGRVVAVGGRSRDALREFKNHLNGRIPSARDMKIIREINHRLFAELRAHPEAQAKLKAFVEKRKWPDPKQGQSIAEQAGLVYFSSQLIDLRIWAKKNGYSFEQLRDAGWLRMVFDDQGSSRFVPVANDAIRIPFFDANGNILLWRSRLLNPKSGQGKYLSWPMDRSLIKDLTIPETIYNGWKLDPRLGLAKGKTIIVTEGEFKCLITSVMTDYVVLGIPGITQFTPEMARAIGAAEPKNVVVLLDRDPQAKALQRLDSITDSEKAAYHIARDLLREGVEQTRIGILPDVFDGGKVGADDLLLAKGAEPLHRVVQEAMVPGDYAKKIGLDETLDQLHVKMQRLTKALDRYQNAVDRGENPVSESLVQGVREERDRARDAFRREFRRQYPRAKSFQQPAYALDFVPAAPTKRESLLVRLSSGAAVAEQRLNSPVLVLQFDSPATLARTFPSDDYQVEYSAHLAGGEGGMTVPIAIFSSHYEKIVALGQMGDPAQPGAFSRFTRQIHAFFGR